MSTGHPASVRLAGPDDLAAVTHLLGAHGSERRSTDDPQALAVAIGAQAVLVAEGGGRLLGVVVAGFDGWRGNMYRLTVDATHRRRGVATVLVRAAEVELARRGCRRITVLADREDAGATAFWRSVGYLLDPELVRAVKDLPPALSPPPAGT